MRRLRSITALAALASFAACVLAAAPAGAGGWAVTTLDAMPADPVAGVPTDVGYTIRQHGVTPVALEDTAIVVEAAGGATQRFAGRADGAVGHYLATVTFPTGGALRWHVEQGWFAPQDLGTIQVAASDGSHVVTAGNASGPTAATAQPALDDGAANRWPSPLRWALLAATAVALVAFGAAVAGWRQHRRPEPSPLRPA
jgi:hypothetical protein